ncbi:endonuclease domain-containing protein [Paraflavisolibacter sp. H34]|uniref:endonuclease domain-containing protein n=1 Tax=Huijunlia imazamoxiresistens TaxID=3127457 RepID=UPI00301764A0
MADGNNELFLGASGQIFENARNLRHRLTKAEALLWEKLRNRRLKALKFRRQHPVDQFVLDFYCPDHKIAVELDGSAHEGSEAQLYDAARTKKLEQLGIHVIRFSNDEVEKDIHIVMRKITDFVKRITS